jgi:hypothetical protein
VPLKLDRKFLLAKFREARTISRYNYEIMYHERFIPTLRERSSEKIAFLVKCLKTILSNFAERSNEQNVIESPIF